MNLSAEREALYADLEQRIGGTRLFPLDLPVPNSNTILLKDESDTLRGMPHLNHYGRVFVPIYKAWETTSRLKPGGMAFDSSQGNAALALTAIGNYLHFDPYAIVPGTPQDNQISHSMHRLLATAGAQLVWTGKKDYVNDFEEAIIAFRKEHPRSIFLNHSMGSKRTDNNAITLTALGRIAEEVLAEVQPDYFIGVWGNGSSLYGPARVFKEHGVQSIGWELLSQAIAYECAYGAERLEDVIGLSPAHIAESMSDIHGVPGSSYRGRGQTIAFPHIRNALTGSTALIHDTRLVADQRIIDRHRELVSAENKRQTVASLPRLDDTMMLLERNGMHFGRTTAGNIAVALNLAERVQNKVIVTLLYDTQLKYDTPLPQ